MRWFESGNDHLQLWLQLSDERAGRDQWGCRESTQTGSLPTSCRKQNCGKHRTLLSHFQHRKDQVKATVSFLRSKKIPAVPLVFVQDKYFQTGRIYSCCVTRLKKKKISSIFLQWVAARFFRSAMKNKTIKSDNSYPSVFVKVSHKRQLHAEVSFHLTSGWSGEVFWVQWVMTVRQSETLYWKCCKMKGMLFC